MAVDLAKLAQEFKNDADDLNIKKQQLALSISAEDRAWNADERAWRADERAGEKFTYDMWKDERAFQTGQDRFDRTQAVQEAWLNRSITEDDKKQAQENILSMANSGIPLEQITAEELTELEIRAGYAEGSLEAIYSRAFDQSRLGNTMDMLKLEKAQLDVEKSIKSLTENKNTNTSTNNNANTPTGFMTVGNMQVPETGDTFTDTISYLQSSKEQGLLNDFSYKEQINALMDVGGYEENQRGEVESMVNQAMEALSPIVQPENEGSDFEAGGTVKEEDAVIGEEFYPKVEREKKEGYYIDGKRFPTIEDVSIYYGEDVAQKVIDTPFKLDMPGEKKKEEGVRIITLENGKKIKVKELPMITTSK